MKLKFYNHLFMAAVAILMILSGCKKEETMEFDVPSGSVLIKVGGYDCQGTTSFTSDNVSAVTVTSKPAGWEVVNVDIYAKTITVQSPTFDEIYSEELAEDERAVESGNVNLKVYTPSGKSKSVEIYVAIVPNEVSYVGASANCYIANELNTRYLFDPYIGGTNTSVATSYVEIIWQTSANLIKYVDMQKGDDGKMVAWFYVEELTDEDGEALGKLTPGNALIGAYSESGELLWTWHVWVTNSNPTADENTITLNGQTLMNINLGADCNSEGAVDDQNGDDNIIYRSYGMYYQWGRRTPLVGPSTWNFSLNLNRTLYNNSNLSSLATQLDYVDSNVETGTINWAESNPLWMICGSAENGYDWLYSGHEEFWNTTSKSDHDPCPAGWRIPDSSIYENLTILGEDDDKSWTEAQGMYGWHLQDTTNGNTYFFTAQGRRNYLDGRLDIVNDDDERPIPWSGYYWTSSVEGDKGVAMFFDLNSATRTWNGFDAAALMQRANAFPVRCVRIEE